MSFHVGQKVVCISNIPHGTPAQVTQEIPKVLAVGAVYSIRWIGRFGHRVHGEYVGVMLNEVIRRQCPLHQVEVPFDLCRFRPLIERKASTETGMSILRKVASDAAKRRNLVVTR